MVAEFAITAAKNTHWAAFIRIRANLHFMWLPSVRFALVWRNEENMPLINFLVSEEIPINAIKIFLRKSQNFNMNVIPFYYTNHPRNPTLTSMLFWDLRTFFWYGFELYKFIQDEKGFSSLELFFIKSLLLT